MKRFALISLVVLSVFVITIVVVRFVPGAGKIFGATVYDTYADGRCEVHENAVYRLSYALLGRPGPKTTRLKVRVSDERGAPIAGARVEARPTREERRSSPSSTTDSKGQAELNFSEDFTVKSAILYADAPGFSTVMNKEVSVDDSVIAVQLVRVQKVTLRGVVVDENEKPVRVKILANGCGPRVETSDTGGFEVECTPNFEVGISSPPVEREEDAFRVDLVTVKPPVDAALVKLLARRKGATAHILFPNGDAPGSNVMLTQRDGKDAPVVYAAWRQGELFGFVGLEPGHWWVYSHRVDEPRADLHRTEFTATADGLTDLFLLPASPVFKFEQ